MNPSTPSPTVYESFFGALFVEIVGFVVINLIVQIVSKIFRLRTKRPSAITTICLIFFVSLLLGTPKLFSFQTALDIYFYVFSVINQLLLLVWMIGLWNMKRWSIVGYTINLLAVQFILTLRNQWNIYSLLLFFFVIVGFRYYAKME